MAGSDEAAGVRVTRIAVVAGIAALGFLCWLAAIGFTAAIGPLVTLAALFVLVAGGNWLSDRRVPEREPRRTPGSREESPERSSEGT